MSAKQQESTPHRSPSPSPKQTREEREEAEKQSTMEWAKETLNEQYETWMPWVEDIFLKYFTKDNKASYVARDQLNQTKVTGIKQVDQVQDGVNNVAADQLGQGGMLEGVGDFVSKEGVERADGRRKENRDDDNNNKGNEEKNTGIGAGLVENVPVVSGLL
ncbi:hypothetical protein GGS20DRAFT_391834 [Poronia punctata]|nr:hypothetical protein GGS20DRAFT_391834 [Poronia punctata]